MEQKTMRGGTRKGAGRKALPDTHKAKNRSIKLTDADWLKFKLLGGAKWLREAMNKISIDP